MCWPIFGAAGATMSAGAASTLSILNTVASVGSVVMNYMGQMQQAAAQEAYYQANKQASDTATADSYRQTLEQQRLDQANDARKTNSYLLQARQNVGTALASNQNEGNSLNMTLRDLMGQADRNIALTEADAAIRDQNVQNQLAAIGAQGANRVASVQRGQSPNFLSMAISGLGTYTQSRLSSKQFQYSNPMTQTRQPQAYWDIYPKARGGR